MLKDEIPEFETAKNSTIIYPNPFSHGKLNIKVSETQQNEKISITIFNILGEAVYTHQTSANKTSYDIQLLNLNLTKGIYNIHITVGNNSSNHKLIIE
ncbi:MAG: T9SS type A sorting domain-containing protein [bacterium]